MNCPFCGETIPIIKITLIASAEDLNDNPPIRKNDASGYIYLIRAETGQYKIGRTKNIQSRLSAMQSASPHRLMLIHSYWSRNASEEELGWHRMFAGMHLNGEWYDLTDDAVTWFKHAISDEEPAI